MFLPIGTDRPLERRTRTNYVLIGVIVAAYIAQVLVRKMDPTGYIELLSKLWIQGGDGFRVWGLVTSVFLHGGLWHLFGNLIFLFAFGGNVEDRFGRVGYLLFFLSGGIAASACQALFDDDPAIGASGAVSAVTGAYIVLFPKTRIRILSFFGMFAIPALWVIGFGLYRDFIGIGIGGTGVAHLAHLGGYAWGASISLFLLWRRILDREPWDLFTIMRQAHRRKQFREAARQSEQAVRTRRRAGEAGPVSEIIDEEAVHARAEVSKRLAERQLDAAAEAYRSLLNKYADQPVVVTLNRNHQYTLANHFMASKDYQTAAACYELFIQTYASDSETPQIKLLLGRINARYLNDPVRARALLGEAIDALDDDDAVNMARRELESLA